MWINSETLQVYNLHSGIRREFKNVSMPSMLTNDILQAFNIYPVSMVDRPLVDHTKNIVEKPPALVNGTWTQVWAVTDASAEEVAKRTQNTANSVRSQRDNLLASTDWLVIKAQETGVATDQAWVDYRQALRDITDHVNFPHLEEVDWPVKPE